MVKGSNRHLAVAISVVGLLLMVAALGISSDRASAQEALQVTITDGISITETLELQIYVTVSRADGQPVPGLGREAFRIVEKPSLGDEREVDTFTVQTESEMRAAAGEENPGPPPLTIALALDTSESMRGLPLEEAKAAAVEFVNSRPDSDEIALFAFSTDVRRIQDFTSDKETVKAAIAGLQPGGTTALYESVYEVSSALAGRGVRRRFVMLTDGQNDTDLPRTRQAAIDAAKAADAPAYMLGFGTTLDSALEPIARETGGRYLVRPGANDIRAMFDDVGALLDQYVLTYVPRVEAEETKYRVTVEVVSDQGNGSDFLFVVVPPATPTPVGPTPTPVLDDNDGDGGARNRDLPSLGILALIAALMATIAGGLWWRQRPTTPPDGPVPDGATSPARYCPRCGREMDPQWVDCFFCQHQAGEPGGETRPAWPIPALGDIRPLDDPSRGTVILEGQQAWLVVERGPMVGMQFSVPAQGDTRIGRATDNDIVLDQDPAVSRHHGRVKPRDKRLHLFNLSRTQSLLVNGEPVNGHPLEEGDRITMGRTVLVFMTIGGDG